MRSVWTGKRLWIHRVPPVDSSSVASISATSSLALSIVRTVTAHLPQALCPRSYTAEPGGTRHIVSRRYKLGEVVTGDPRQDQAGIHHGIPLCITPVDEDLLPS